jgi:hypothetical protein
MGFITLFKPHVQAKKMIVLSATTDKIQVVLSSTVTTSQLHCMASWRDITSTPTYTPGRSVVLTNGTTDVDFVASPAASTQRLIDYISVFNSDTSASTVTIKLDASGTDYTLIKQQIAPGETLVYTSDSGFFVIGTPAGEEFTTAEKSKLAGLKDWTYVTLASNELNSTTTAITSALQFSPAASTRYEIEGRFFLQSAATTTGVRWGLVWPSGLTQNAAWGVSPNTLVAFTSRFWGNTTAQAVLATGIGVINEGFYGQLQALMVVGASPGGVFGVTLASEIAASEVRIMQNSFIRYRTF